MIVGWRWEEIQKHVIYPAWKGKWHIRVKLLYNSAWMHISDVSSWRSRTSWHPFFLIIFLSAYRFKWNLSMQIWGAVDFIITLLQCKGQSFYWRDVFLLQLCSWVTVHHLIPHQNIRIHDLSGPIWGFFWCKDDSAVTLWLGLGCNQRTASCLLPPKAVYFSYCVPRNLIAVIK